VQRPVCGGIPGLNIGRHRAQVIDVRHRGRSAACGKDHRSDVRGSGLPIDILVAPYPRPLVGAGCRDESCGHHWGFELPVEPSPTA